ncbi:hypothetical protein SO802_007336 [Lithocarpus litseifolius]|uniref:RNase H type-1 domain-containing protein n=1 Tax=Lithocarpus litseifolius TaxID=425828 RepID=A0AAW2DNM0_9ROSI
MLDTNYEEAVTHLNPINAELASLESHAESSLPGIKSNACAPLSPTNNAQVRCRPFLAEKLVCSRDLCQGSFALKSPHLAETFAYIAWSISHNRNAQTVGAVTVPLEKIYTDAVERLQEFHAVQDIPLKQRMVDHPTHWLPPLPTQYKANSDGAIFQDTGLAGIGVVIRDFEGMVLAALSERIPLPSTVEDVEALACRKAISFSIELGLQDVVFEVDSEIIYRHLISDSTCMTAFGHIVDDSRWLSKSLRSASFSHVRRNGNRVADKLAKLAKFLCEPQIWIEDIHRDVILDSSFLPS